MSVCVRVCVCRLKKQVGEEKGKFLTNLGRAKGGEDTGFQTAGREASEWI
jgi:hypothetical protein